MKLVKITNYFNRSEISEVIKKTIEKNKADTSGEQMIKSIEQRKTKAEASAMKSAVKFATGLVQDLIYQI